ncbi:MAG: ABC transporter ATP-binding protein/permease [Lachnospiraceae bacterium]|nr:ABC transporter ATP-binding protein/permease [Lachnospiraceae bacterium]
MNRGGGGRAQNMGATTMRLLRYLGKYKGRFTLVCICIVFSAIVTAMASLFIQSLIDDYITPMLSISNPDFQGLAMYLIRMAVLFGFGVLAARLYNWIMVRIAQGILKDVRDEMFEHMQRLPIRYFDTHTHGDVMSRYTNDTDTLRQALTMSIPQMLNSAVTMVAVFVSMLLVSFWLTLIVIGFLVIVVFIIRVVLRGSSKYFVKQQNSLGEVNGYVEEMINGQKVVKVFCHEEQAKEGFDKVNTELYENAARANTYVNILMPIMNNLGYLVYVVIAIVGGALGIAGVTNISLRGVSVLTLGAIASFLQLSRSFISPIAQISNQFNFLVMALAGAERIFNLMDEEVEQDDGDVTMVRVKFDEDGNMVECPERTKHWAWKVPKEDGSFELVEMKGDVEFEHVDFGYVPDKTVLHDITLYAKPGQKVAFVGKTGAGKTTITNLINRFYDIQSGTITYDGIDISRIEKPSLRRSLGVVLQDVNLFTGTVMENIRYGKLEATDEECIAAAKLANADSFIQMLPHGYDTVLEGDGSGLSQGQRQLISIARAAVADPPVMIMDEATSSIDTRTEQIVQEGMDALMKGRTVFVIAHRLSTIMNSDVIMVLELGNIIERGNHDQLIAEKGTYYQLYTGATDTE